MPVTTNSIVPLVKTWSTIIEEQIEAYSKEMAQKLKDFKTRTFWEDNLTPAEATASMAEAEKFLADELKVLSEKTNLVKTFDFPQLVKGATECFDEMQTDLKEMQKLWQVLDTLENFVADSNNILWCEMNTDELDEGSKNQVKAVKALHKCTRWSKAFKKADKVS